MKYYLTNNIYLESVSMEMSDDTGQNFQTLGKPWPADLREIGKGARGETNQTKNN